MANKYQTLSGFLLSPFNKKANVQKDTEYNAKYNSFMQSNKIRLYAMCVVEDSYYLHIKVPSESQKNGNYEYDVIIRFFTEDPAIAAQSHLRNYFIQFFSNSPSFMYQYAYLYKEGGYLIKALYDKLDAEYINVAPEKTNANMNMSYDKSIYFACRFLSDKQFRYLNKTGPLLMKKKTESKFFQDITDFKSIKFDSSVIAEERKLSRLIDSKSPKSRKASAEKVGKKVSSNSTTKNGLSSIHVTKKITGGSHKISKKMASKSTRKK